MPTLIAGTLVLAMPDVSGLTPYACVTPVFAHLLPEVVAFTAVLLIFIQRRRSLGWPSETNRPKYCFGRRERCGLERRSRYGAQPFPLLCMPPDLRRYPRALVYFSR